MRIVDVTQTGCSNGGITGCALRVEKGQIIFVLLTRNGDQAILVNVCPERATFFGRCFEKCPGR